ncbi:hypothetical protein [Paenibacillus sp. Mc5Re-14]|uniref:hypothetical protein n=1 Tax=Paenibacillus sp. Mc5Re-14 TaxID=1030529 RepID=UPI000A9C1749|nr:hypothetical protein [Paenibacillus sp. Mc5Re-14]
MKIHNLEDTSYATYKNIVSTPCADECTAHYAIVLSACSSQENGAQSSPTAGQAANSTNLKETASTTPTTREYTDFQKRKVTIPVNPQKIVYVGSDPGDLLALGVRPAGASLSVI